MFDFGHMSTVPWKLAIPSASVALSICCMDEKLQEKDIVMKLLEDGIAFHTLQWKADFEGLPGKRTLPTPPLLCVAEGIFTPIDFEYYQRQCDVLLRQHHAWAALLHGGFLGCIAKETIRLSEALEGATYSHSLSSSALLIFPK